LCGGSSSAAFTTRDRNRAIDAKPFRYRRCGACRSLFLENVPQDLGPYYPQDYHALPTVDELRRFAAGERYRMDIVARHAAVGGRLTEIGPGNGIFAVQAVDAGFDTAAIEMDAAVCEYLRTTLGIEAIESDRPEQELAAMPASRVVAAWHVLEHVPDPWALLDAAAHNLEVGGVLVVATPNPRSFGLRLLGPRWPHVDAPRHLFLIDHEALISRAAAAGLEPVALTSTDAGGLHWNAFAWHFLLRRPGIGAVADELARRAGIAIAALLAAVERRGMRGAAYTIVLRKR
jgi:SAM-dependent methyltransferase